MYVPLEIAAREIIRRQQKAKKLVAKVDEFLGLDCPIPQGGNFAFLARHIATARFEDIQFAHRSIAFELEPVWLTFEGDNFLTNNPSKIRLIRLFIYYGQGRRGGYRIERFDLTNREDFERLNGSPLVEIYTRWGEPITSFHLRARRAAGLEGWRVVDLTSWLKPIGRASNYYRQLFAAAVTRGILFEDFHSSGFPTLDQFRDQVVTPAWEYVCYEFGQPLVVKHPIFSSSSEENIMLNCYPPQILSVVSAAQ